MLSIKDLAPFGVEVDLDLKAPLSPGTAEQLRELYDTRRLLVFRGQSLTQDEQAEFASIFGPLLRLPLDRLTYISNQPGAGNLGDSELAFHSDLSFSPKPYRGISLLAVDVENGRTSTRFIDAIRAYASLPAELRRRIDNYHALHVFGASLSGRNGEDLPEHLPRQVHPLVMRHPRTAEPILYANWNQTARIVELPKAKSDALLEELFGYLYAPGAEYEHRWSVGDLAMWDNLALQHARGDISQVGRRTLQRITLGEAGFFEQHPQFMPAEFATHGAVPRGEGPTQDPDRQDQERTGP